MRQATQALEVLIDSYDEVIIQLDVMEKLLVTNNLVNFYGDAHLDVPQLLWELFLDGMIEMDIQLYFLGLQQEQIIQI